VKVEIERLSGEYASGGLLVPQRQQALNLLRGDAGGIFRQEVFLGMALRPQNSARPSSATSAITWLLRSIDHSFSASEARSAWADGIMREPGSLAL
jgi:hypothetical protein